MPPLWLCLGCLATAVVYASVGLGGGSTYAALHAQADLDTESLRLAVLAMNVVVAGVGHFVFGRAGHLRTRLLAPFLVTSLPAAFLGGWLRVPGPTFTLILAATLGVVGWRMLRTPAATSRAGTVTARLAWTVGPLLGGAAGFLAGLVGIGGGVLLAPLLVALRWANSKEASAVSAVFVWANSATGLGAHLLRGNRPEPWLWPLLAVVLIGGIVGARLGAVRLRVAIVQRIFGVVVLATAVRLVWRLAG